LEKRRRELRSRLTRIQGLYTRGEITSQEYERTHRLLQREIAELESPVVRSQTRAKELVKDFGALWSELTRDEKKLILHKMLRDVYVKGHALERLEPHPSFKVLFTSAQH